MDRKHNKTLVPLAKTMRKNMTKEERLLWYDFLKDHPVRFLRQKVIGKCIADFYCASAKIVIELDGSQHFEQEGERYDAERDKYLKEFGIRVIRIPNNEVNQNFTGVCEFLDNEIRQAVKNKGSLV